MPSRSLCRDELWGYGDNHQPALLSLGQVLSRLSAACPSAGIKRERERQRERHTVDREKESFIHYVFSIDELKLCRTLQSM